MQTRVDGRNYVILYDDDRVPEKINKNKVDGALKKLETALKSIQDVIDKAYDDNYNLYRMLDKCIFDYYPYCTGLDDGKCSTIDSMLYSVRQLQETLKEDDEIPDYKEAYENSILLEDLGYKNSWGGRRGVWEKVLEDTDEKEVVEEIQRFEDPLRRIRTTYWEKTDYGKSSTSITYKKLRIGKKLMRAIENTARAQKED